MRTSSIIAALLVLCLTAIPAQAKTFYPMIHKISPCAVPLGQTLECQVSAEHGFYAPTTVLISGTGVTGEVVPPMAAAGEKPAPMAGVETIKVRFTVAPDALPGLRDVRIMTARGPSTLGQLQIVRDPLTIEDDKNDTLQTAQLVTLPATVCGGIESNEDIDVYRFQVAAPTDLTFNLACQRFQRKLGPLAYHSDPILTLRNSAGVVLAANDNFFGSDPLLNYRFTIPGDYFLEIRDVRYVGYRHWAYSLIINNRPFLLQAIPGVIAPGVPTTAKVFGFNVPDQATQTVTLPSDAPSGLHLITPTPLTAGQPVDPVFPVYVSRLPSVPEQPVPNNTPDVAQAITSPVGIMGVIEAPDDIDCYAIEAKKDQRLSFVVVARAVGSPIDAYLRLLNDKGEVILENDDRTDKTGNADCRNEVTHPDANIVNWTAPADGRFFIEIRDTHLRGGDRFTYYLEARPARPGIHIDMDSDKSVLAPGVSTPIFIRGFREEGFTGPINLTIEGLPAGVTAICGQIPASGQDACVYLKAAADAVPGSCANIRVIGDAQVEGPDGAKLTAVATPFQELRRDGGARYLVAVDMHTVGIADVLDLKSVSVSEKVLVMKPGETRTVQVKFERTPGFKEPVTITAIHFQHVWTFGRCLPTSVTVDEAASKLRVVGDEVQGSVVLKVAADAKAAEPRLIPMMANVAVNFSIKMIYCSDPILFSIEAPEVGK